MSKSDVVLFSKVISRKSKSFDRLGGLLGEDQTNVAVCLGQSSKIPETSSVLDTCHFFSSEWSQELFRAHLGLITTASILKLNLIPTRDSPPSTVDTQPVLDTFAASHTPQIQEFLLATDPTDSSISTELKVMPPNSSFMCLQHNHIIGIPSSQ